MKKILGIIILGLFLSSNVFAEVYFCSDLDGTGFAGLKNNREGRDYRSEKFKAKITFDPPSFSAKDLGNTWSYLKCLKPLNNFSMTCSNTFGDVITTDASTGNESFFKYSRAITYGRNDDIVLYHGTCEKF